VQPEEIKVLLSNKNAQRALLSRVFDSGNENLDAMWDEEMVARTVRNLAPLENTYVTFSS